MLKFSGLADLISCFKRCANSSSFQAASQVGAAAVCPRRPLCKLPLPRRGVNALPVPNARAIWHTATQLHPKPRRSRAVAVVALRLETSRNPEQHRLSPEAAPTRAVAPLRPEEARRDNVDTEAGKPSGVTRRREAHSGPY